MEDMTRFLLVELYKAYLQSNVNHDLDFFFSYEYMCTVQFSILN